MHGTNIHPAPTTSARKKTFSAARAGVHQAVPMVERALEVASWGLGGVFALTWDRGDRCSCGAPHVDPEGKRHGAGKHPRAGTRGFKDGTGDVDEIRAMWALCPQANVGLALGEGFCALDVDPGHGGEGSFAALVEKLGPLPEKVRIHSTPSGGRHYIMRGDVPQTSGALAPGVDTRSGGRGYIVAPGSSTPWGTYSVATAVEVDDLANIPWAWAQALERSHSATQDDDPERVWAEGERHDRMLRLAGRLRHIGLAGDAIFASLLVVNDERCSVPLPEEEVRRIAVSVGAYPPGVDEEAARERIEDWVGEGREARAARREASTGPVVRMASDVAPERVSWLWDGWLPGGKLVVLDGDPSLGKSTLSIDLASRITTGAHWPDGSQGCVPGGVVLASAEDGAADTTVPRLIAAGADLERVAIIDGVNGPQGIEPISLPEHVEEISQAAERVNAKLVVVDPLMAFLGAGTNSFRDQDVRRVLRPLSEMADRTGVTILIIRHLNKSTGGSALYRGGGSIGIIGAARLGLLVAPDPEDDTRRILAVSKSNLAAKPQSLSYELVSFGDHGAARIGWGDASEFGADELLAHRPGRDAGAKEDAIEFLRDFLGNGPKFAAEVKFAAEQEGISERTLQRAKQGIVTTQREGFGADGRFLWRLAEAIDGQAGGAETIGGHPQDVATYGDGGNLWGKQPSEGISKEPTESDWGLFNELDRKTGKIVSIDAKKSLPTQRKFRKKAAK
jgi:hypothetical protein